MRNNITSNWVPNQSIIVTALAWYFNKIWKKNINEINTSFIRRMVRVQPWRGLPYKSDGDARRLT